MEILVQNMKQVCTRRVSERINSFPSIKAHLGSLWIIRIPSRQGHFVYPLMSSKPRIRVKRHLHTDQVILQLCWWAGLKKLFAPKGIQILDLMGLPQKPMPLPLEPTPLGFFFFGHDNQFCFPIKYHILKITINHIM